MRPGGGRACAEEALTHPGKRRWRSGCDGGRGGGPNAGERDPAQQQQPNREGDVEGLPRGGDAEEALEEETRRRCGGWWRPTEDGGAEMVPARRRMAADERVVVEVQRRDARRCGGNAASDGLP